MAFAGDLRPVVAYKQSPARKTDGVKFLNVFSGFLKDVLFSPAARYGKRSPRKDSEMRALAVWL